MNAAAKAVRYVLDRAQTDPDFRYYMLDTQGFHLLCLAEAEATGEPVEAVEERRRKDRQPVYRWRLPDLVVERWRRELLEGEAELGAEAWARIESELERRLEHERSRALERG